MSWVRESSIAVPGMTRTTTRSVAAGAATIRASTTLSVACAIETTSAASTEPTVTKAGAAAPGPNAATSVS